MNTPEHWKRNPRYPDRDSRTRKAKYEMRLYALQALPRRRFIRRLRLRWWLGRH